MMKKKNKSKGRAKRKNDVNTNSRRTEKMSLTREKVDESSLQEVLARSTMRRVLHFLDLPIEIVRHIALCTDIYTVSQIRILCKYSHQNYNFDDVAFGSTIFDTFFKHVMSTNTIEDIDEIPDSPKSISSNMTASSSTSTASSTTATSTTSATAAIWYHDSAILAMKRLSWYRLGIGYRTSLFQNLGFNFLTLDILSLLNTHQKVKRKSAKKGLNNVSLTLESTIYCPLTIAAVSYLLASHSNPDLKSLLVHDDFLALRYLCFHLPTPKIFPTIMNFLMLFMGAATPSNSNTVNTNNTHQNNLNGPLIPLSTLTTCFLKVVQKGCIETCKLLISYGTVFFFTTYYAPFKMNTMLGVNPSVENDTPLLLACQEGHTALVEFLLSFHSVNPSSTHLIWAAGFGFHQILAKLLEVKDGLDVNAALRVSNELLIILNRSEI
jgi:hypothetical protein